jgi:hypothetical protein
MPSLHEQCLDAIVNMLANAGLSGVSSVNIQKQFLPDLANASFPFVFVTLEGVRKGLAPFSTEEDERRLPVAVLLMDRFAFRESGKLGAWLDWEEKIDDAFLMQVLTPAVPGCWHVEMKPAEAIDARRILGAAYQHAKAGYVLEPWVTTPRKRAA